MQVRGYVWQSLLCLALTAFVAVQGEEAPSVDSVVDVTPTGHASWLISGSGPDAPAEAPKQLGVPHGPHSSVTMKRDSHGPTPIPSAGSTQHRFQGVAGPRISFGASGCLASCPQNQRCQQSCSQPKGPCCLQVVKPVQPQLQKVPRPKPVHDVAAKPIGGGPPSMRKITVTKLPTTSIKQAGKHPYGNLLKKYYKKRRAAAKRRKLKKKLQKNLKKRRKARRRAQRKRETKKKRRQVTRKQKVRHRIQRKRRRRKIQRKKQKAKRKMKRKMKRIKRKKHKANRKKQQKKQQAKHKMKRKSLRKKKHTQRTQRTRRKIRKARRKRRKKRRTKRRKRRKHKRKRKKRRKRRKRRVRKAKKKKRRRKRAITLRAIHRLKHKRKYRKIRRFVTKIIKRPRHPCRNRRRGFARCWRRKLRLAKYVFKRRHKRRTVKIHRVKKHKTPRKIKRRRRKWKRTVKKIRKKIFKKEFKVKTAVKPKKKFRMYYNEGKATGVDTIHAGAFQYGHRKGKNAKVDWLHTNHRDVIVVKPRFQQVPGAPPAKLVLPPNFRDGTATRKDFQNIRFKVKTRKPSVVFKTKYQKEPVYEVVGNTHYVNNVMPPQQKKNKGMIEIDEATFTDATGQPEEKSKRYWVDSQGKTHK